MLRPHRHRELELNLVARGQITYVVGGQRYILKQRSLVWLYPEQEHQLVDRSSDAQYYVAVFKPSMIREACKGSRYEGLLENGDTLSHVINTQLSVTDFDYLKRTMDGILQDGIDPELLNREAGFGLSAEFSFSHQDPDWLNAGLRNLLLLGWRYQLGHNGGTGQLALHPAVSRVLEHIYRKDASLNSQQLARACKSARPI